MNTFAMGDQTLALDTSSLSKEQTCIPQSQETYRPCPGLHMFESSHVIEIKIHEVYSSN